MYQNCWLFKLIFIYAHKLIKPPENNNTINKKGNAIPAYPKII